MKKNLVLLGMMAVGKTTLGKIVAKKQKLKFIDIDTSIEKKNVMTIEEIFKKKGEKFFRMEEEKETLKSLKKNKNKIIKENLKDVKNVKFLVGLLEKAGAVQQYTILPEKNGGMVSQHENTIEIGTGITTKINIVN